MSADGQAARHDANFVTAISMMASVASGGWTARVGRIPLAVTGIPVSFFNAAWIIEPPDPGELDESLVRLRATGLPFMVHVRDDLPEAVEAVTSRGLVNEGVLPCFALPATTPPPPPERLVISRVGPADLVELQAATAAGFGMPVEMVELVYPAAMLAAPGVQAFVGRVDGEVACTAMSVRDGATVGVYSIATLPAYRGRGYGTAITWHLMADAEPGWDLAVLQASEMGRPVYERMGFRLVREFMEYADGRSA
jgi:ribosomal protein S18 acetylase RimI-like enzyme